MPPASKSLQKETLGWKGEGAGSGTGQGAGSLLGWEDLPHLKGVRAGGGLAPGSLRKQLVRFLPFCTYLVLWCPVRAPRCTRAARGGEHLPFDRLTADAVAVHGFQDLGTLQSSWARGAQREAAENTDTLTNMSLGRGEGSGRACKADLFSLRVTRCVYVCGGLCVS